MFNYLKYMLSVPRKFIMTWAIAPALYFTILPLSFANESVEGLLIDTQKEAFRGMSENDTMMNLLGIDDWDNVFDTNLKSVLRLSKLYTELVQSSAQPQGNIINNATYKTPMLYLFYLC